MRLSLIGLSVLSLLGVTAPAVAAPEGYAVVRRVADLPEPVRALLNGPMAEPGQPFEIGDAIAPGSNLPFQRMIWAAKLADGRYVIHYERGGWGHSTLTSVIKPTGWEGYERAGRTWPGVRFPSPEAFLSTDEAFAAVP
jgi:hypothetical protein